MTETQETRLRENGYFLYQRCHFKPVRQFTEMDGDFFEKTRRLKRDDELGMTEADYYGKQKHPYSYKEFYAASTDKKADIFFCLETMKQYVPCTHEMQEYVMETGKEAGQGENKVKAAGKIGDQQDTLYRGLRCRVCRETFETGA